MIFFFSVLDKDIEAASSLINLFSSKLRLCFGNLIGVLEATAESIRKFAGVLSTGAVGGLPGCIGGIPGYCCWGIPG